MVTNKVQVNMTLQEKAEIKWNMLNSFLKFCILKKIQLHKKYLQKERVYLTLMWVIIFNEGR